MHVYCYCTVLLFAKNCFKKLRDTGRFEFRTKTWKQGMGKIPFSKEGGDSFDNSSAKNGEKTLGGIMIITLDHGSNCSPRINYSAGSWITLVAGSQNSTLLRTTLSSSPPTDTITCKRISDYLTSLPSET
jgi:hypothetical protein